jgi:hypothetical protein
MLQPLHKVSWFNFIKKSFLVSLAKHYTTPSELVASIDVSRNKMCLDTSILGTINMDRREYLNMCNNA